MDAMDATFAPAPDLHRPPTADRGHPAWRWPLAAALACLLALVLGRGARADYVRNDAAPAVTLTVAVNTPTIVNYWIDGPSPNAAVQPTDQDGCNAADGTPVTVNVLAFDAAAVTPSTLVFDACNVAQPVTFVAPNLGTFLILANASDAGGGIVDRHPATFNLHVVPSTNAAPTVAVTGVADGGTYPIGGVDPICLVDDAEDGPAAFAASLSPVTGPLAGYGLGSQTASCAYTDTGGLSTGAQATYTLADDVAPVLHLPADLTVEATGPTGAAVAYDASASDAVDAAPVVACDPPAGSTFGFGPTTVTCTATDVAGNVAAAAFVVTVVDMTPPAFAGVPEDATIEAEHPAGAAFVFAAPTATDLVDGSVAVSCEPASGSIFPLGPTTVLCAATDAAGNAASAEFLVTVVDTTPPTVNCGGADGTWHAADVETACTATDAGSGLARAEDASFSLVTGVPDGTEDADAHTGSRQVCDAAANCAAAGPVGGHRVDKQAPTDVVLRGFDGETFPFGFVPPPPTCDAVDAGSGLAACAVTGYATAVGRHTLTATAVDAVGNQATAAFAYEVHRWTLKGFAWPISMSGRNLAEAGATVRLKFEVIAGTVELTDRSVITVTAQRVRCGTGAALGDPIVVATDRDDLLYDKKEGRFAAKWHAPARPGTCWNLTATTDDGSSLTASFKLKRATRKTWW